MRYITKRPEPVWYQSFKHENRALNWNRFSSPRYKDEKRKLKRELLEEQHFLCGYCGKRIDETDSHIEHIIPRAQVQNHRISDLSYHNLLASCPANSYEEDVDTCGHAKGSWYEADLFVSPHNENCEMIFTYTALGQIIPASPDPQTSEYKKATKTIEKLALDTYALAEARRAAIEGLLGEDAQSFTPEQIESLSNFLQTPDAQGRLFNYCFVVKRVLEQMQ